jgi:hypothetical protein
LGYAGSPRYQLLLVGQLANRTLTCKARQGSFEL